MLSVIFQWGKYLLPNESRLFILLAWKKLKVARKNCSVERIFRERTLTHISRNYSTMNYCTNVIISDCPFYFVHFHHNFEGIELK